MLIQTYFGCYLVKDKWLHTYHQQLKYTLYNSLTKHTADQFIVDVSKPKLIKVDDKIHECYHLPPLFDEVDCIIEKRIERTIAEDLNLERKYELRRDQATIMNSNTNPYSCVYVLPTGFGKTIIGIESIIRSRVLTTMIVCPKIILVQQWIENIKHHLPKYLVIDYTSCRNIPLNNDHQPLIIVTSIQTLVSLSSKASDAQHISIVKTVDFVIYDEIHMFPTACFKNALMSLNPLKRMGLTATFERVDQLHTLFKYFFNEVVAFDVSNTPKKQTTEYHQLYWPRVIQEPKSIRLYGKEVPPCAQLINIVAEDNQRTSKVINYVFTKLDHQNRCWLIVTDRVAHVKQIHSILKLTHDEEITVLTGGDNKRNATKTPTYGRIIIATYGIVNQGFNVPKLNSLIMMTPRSQVVQLFGRIYRQPHLDQPPIIVDIVDSKHWMFQAQSGKRLKQARQEIEKLNLHTYQLSLDT